jgi:hypothetical protein
MRAANESDRTRTTRATAIAAVTPALLAPFGRIEIAIERRISGQKQTSANARRARREQFGFGPDVAFSEVP